MDNMFNKIVNLGQSLSKLTNDELRENGIESIMLFAWSTDFDKLTLSKGRIDYVMSLFGQALSRLSQSSGLSLKELLDGIYACETEIEQREKEGGEPNDLY